MYKSIALGKAKGDRTLGFGMGEVGARNLLKQTFLRFSSSITKIDLVRTLGNVNPAEVLQAICQI